MSGSLEAKKQLNAGMFDRFKYLYCLVAFIFGFFCSWMFATYIYFPDENGLLHRTAAQYFKKASHHDVVEKIDFDDCKLLTASESEKRQGVKAIGVCVPKDEAEDIYFSVALAPTGSVLYSSAEGF